MADSPKEGEAAQALFCAIVDLKGTPFPPIPNYIVFKQNYRREINTVRRKVVTPGVSESGIEQLLLRDNDWFLSSINIANKIFTETKRLAAKTHQKIKPPGLDLFYVRGDKNVMDSIQALFKYTTDRVRDANKTQGKNTLEFANINKWSPADIYLASKDAQRNLKRLAARQKVNIKIGNFRINTIDNFQDYSVLNLLIKHMIDKGDLLPLSLKKSPNGKNTIVKTINYVENDVQLALKKQDIKYHGGFVSRTNDIFNSVDVLFQFSNNKSKFLQFRDRGNTNYSKGKAPTYSYQGVIIGGKAALDGAIGGGAIGQIIAQTDKKLSTKLSLSNQKKKIEEAVRLSKLMNTDMEKAANSTLCKAVYKICVKYGPTTQKFKDEVDFFSKLYIHPKFDKDQNKELRGAVGLADRKRAQFIFSKFLGGSMIAAFDKDKTRANEIVKNLLLYAGSRSRTSSPHFKASDSSSF
mgnify:FL=1|tara:strand:+ start:49 stop:1446 length:1398 start_codon:yes stop_codon:yes gene_type:complete